MTAIPAFLPDMLKVMGLRLDPTITVEEHEAHVLDLIRRGRIQSRTPMYPPVTVPDTKV